MTAEGIISLFAISISEEHYQTRTVLNSAILQRSTPKNKKTTPKHKPKPFPTSLMSYTFPAAAKTLQWLAESAKEVEKVII